MGQMGPTIWAHTLHESLDRSTWPKAYPLRNLCVIPSLVLLRLRPYLVKLLECQKVLASPLKALLDSMVMLGKKLKNYFSFIKKLKISTWEKLYIKAFSKNTFCLIPQSYFDLNNFLMSKILINKSHSYILYHIILYYYTINII